VNQERKLVWINCLHEQQQRIHEGRSLAYHTTLTDSLLLSFQAQPSFCNLLWPQFLQVQGCQGCIGSIHLDVWCESNVQGTLNGLLRPPSSSSKACPSSADRQPSPLPQWLVFSTHGTFLRMAKGDHAVTDNPQEHSQGTVQHKWNASQPRIKICIAVKRHKANIKSVSATWTTSCVL